MLKILYFSIEAESTSASALLLLYWMVTTTEKERERERVHSSQTNCHGFGIRWFLSLSGARMSTAKGTHMFKGIHVQVLDLLIWSWFNKVRNYKMQYIMWADKIINNESEQLIVWCNKYIDLFIFRGRIVSFSSSNFEIGILYNIWHKNVKWNLNQIW